MAKAEVKVKVEFTEGYEKRYTEACCKVLARHAKQGYLVPPDRAEETAEQTAV